MADGTINIGEVNCWTNNGKKHCGNNYIIVYDPGVGIPSGILTKGKINIGAYSSFQEIEITGLVYASDELKFTSIPQEFTVVGGVLARKMSVISAWADLNIYLDNDIITEGAWGGIEPPEGETPPYSPIITIEHWEESY